MSGQPAAERRPSARWVRALPALTLTAVLTITASAEYELARTVLALPPAIAWALPVAIDSYVLAAFRSGRDIRPALAVMAGALTAAMGAHLATNGHREGQALPATVVAPAATAIMTVLVVVAWRVHVLIEHATHEAETTPASAPTRARTAGRASTPQAVGAPRAPDAPSARGVTASTTPAMPPSDTPSRERVPAARSTATTVTATAQDETADGRDPKTDEQILAALTGDPPSIRALMRDHGIGQARASRLHREATRRTEQPGQNPKQTSAASKPSEHETEEIQNHGQEADPEDQRIHDKESHPCITDRVGQSRSTAEAADANSRAVLHVVGEA